MPKIIGVIIHEGAEVSDPFFSELLAGMREGASGLSLRVNPDAQETLDGLIAIGPEGDDPRLARAQSLALPAIVIAGHVSGLPCIDVDNRNMAEMATAHLLSTERQRLALINGKMDTSNGRDRAEGFRTAMNKAGVVFAENLQFEGRFSREGGRAAMETFLRENPPPDAVFAANDHMALGAWDILKSHGLRVPDDVALMGIDDIPEAMEKGLSSIQQPLREMGRRAAEQMENWLKTSQQPAQNAETFKGLLIVRHSA